jgi:HAD superfamily hydrolase (TIGR01549 family)
MARPAFRALSFDLFDTLVDLRMEDLPEFRVGERSMRGTHADLHRVASGWIGLELAEFVASLLASDKELWESTYKVDRELPTLDRFAHFATRIGVSDAALPAALCDTHMSGIAALSRELPNHRDVIGRLGARVPLAVCSNFSHTPTALAVLEGAGLGAAFGAVVISDQSGFRKPRAEIFRETLAKLGATAAEVLHVGDRLDADVRGAADVGMATAWITRRVKHVDTALERYDGPAPTYTISDLEELLTIVG